jgi:hypothetical protein
MPSHSLSTRDLTLARRAYECSEAFEAIGQRFCMTEAGMRRLLRSVGVEPRRPGKKLIQVEAPDVVTTDWRAGLSCRAIEAKHGLVDHEPVAASCAAAASIRPAGRLDARCRASRWVPSSPIGRPGTGAFSLLDSRALHSTTWAEGQGAANVA